MIDETKERKPTQYYRCFIDGQWVDAADGEPIRVENPPIVMDAIKRIETGTVFLSMGIVGYVNRFHDGHKLSGLGGEDGTHGLEGYMQKRTVYMAY